MERKIPAPSMLRLAEVRQFDTESRTFTLMWSAGAQVRRYDFWNDEQWIEELSMRESAVDLTRLNAGAPLLNSHNRSELEDVIGVVEKAWIADGLGYAQVRLSKDPSVDSIATKVAEKVIRNVSVGYDVTKFVEVGRDKESGARIMRAESWQPFEISLVAVGADPQAQTRTRSVGVCEVVINQPAEEPATRGKEQEIMTVSTVPAAGDSAANGEALERARVQGIIEHGEQFADYVSQKETSEAIRNGRSIEQFKDAIMRNMQSKHVDTRDQHIGMDEKEVKKYSIARAIAASITGDWRDAGLERAASQAVEKKLGASPEGFYVPYDAFRDFTAGTAAEAGNLIATDLRTDLFVDALRNAMVMGKLGVRVLAGLGSNLAIPRKTTPGSIGMVTEVQALTETAPVTAQVLLSPKRFGAFVEYSKQAIIQSSMAIEPMLRDDLLQGAGVLLENQAINGSGVSPNIRGIRNTSGVGSVVGGTNGLALAWSHVVGLESACANANAEPDQFSGYLINTKARGTAKTTQKASNLQFLWDNGDQPLNGYRVAVSNNVPSNLTKGTSSGVCSSAIFGSDWSMAVLGLFGAPDIVVDPYSLATTGMVRITLNQFADFGVRQPAAFAVMDDMLTP